MRIGLENKEREIDKTIELLLKFKEGNLSDLLVQLLKKGVSSSDILFIILENLEREGVVSGKRGTIKVVGKVGEEMKERIKKNVGNRLARIKKVFLTPLEISKFYLCPRRLWLEKVVLAKQEKEERGRVWDGEAVHFAARLLFESLPKYNCEEILKRVYEKYENKLTLEKDKLSAFLENLVNFVKEEEIEKIFAEKTIESLKLGLIGTPDAIAIKSDEIFPIDIKLGRAEKLRKEHMLQSVGEALLVQSYFRKNIEKGLSLIHI